MTLRDQAETRGSSPQLAWGVAGLAGLLAFLSLVSLLRPEPASEPPRVLRATIAPPATTGFGAPNFTLASHVAVSPDGRAMVFVAGNQLWLRPLRNATPTSIPGTEGAGFPFWSPDSSAIGFFADGKLKTARVTGGAVAAICDARQGRGGSWGADDTIIFAPDLRSGIYRVESEGGEPERLTEVNQPLHSTHRWPEYLPGGRSFLYLAASHSNPRGAHNGIHVASISGGQTRWVTAADSKPVLSAGRLLFLRQGRLLAQPFNPVESKVMGEADLLAEGVRYHGKSWMGVFSVSRQDVLAYEIDSRDLGAQLTWIDRLGNEQGTLGEGGQHWDLRFSPQGDRLAVAVGSPEPELWIYELDREVRGRLTLETTFNRAPVWSPDGERLAFAARRENGRLNIFLIAARDGGRAQLLLESEVDQVPTSWSPDGQWLAFDQGPAGSTEIWVMPLTGEGNPLPFVQTPPWAGDGRFSPDGKWLLYTSRESGVDQVYVSPFPGSEDRWQLSASGWGSHGRWSPGGDKVYFATAQAMLMEVEMRRRKGGGLDVGMPKILFSYRDDDSLFRGHNGFYDVVGEDERFLLAQGPEREQDQGLIMLVMPWLAELEK